MVSNKEPIVHTKEEVCLDHPSSICALLESIDLQTLPEALRDLSEDTLRALHSAVKDEWSDRRAARGLERWSAVQAAKREEAAKAEEQRAARFAANEGADLYFGYGYGDCQGEQWRFRSTTGVASQSEVEARISRFLKREGLPVIKSTVSAVKKNARLLLFQDV
jgi:hypothetical protein